jgi:phosphoribosylanthranilate isomerase
MTTRVKICGITRPEDAKVAIKCGADALGLVFYDPSPRAVTIEQARKVVARISPFVTVVGLFVNEERERIAEILSEVRIDLLQFHGDETPEECAGHSRPYIKAIRMRESVDLEAELGRYSQAEGLLLDTYRKGTPGGTGDSFDWDLIPAEIAGSITLAGGLDSENVAQAIRQVQPYAVDVSGGVEKEKGIKDEEKIAAFMRGVESANS